MHEEDVEISCDSILATPIYKKRGSDQLKDSFNDI
jgi:hypothetical protein